MNGEHGEWREHDMTVGSIKNKEECRVILGKLANVPGLEMMVQTIQDAMWNPDSAHKIDISIDALIKYVKKLITPSC